eukprot:CAMPEP_0197541028 /NCGR_PEP_ID=MMETSP1318-20131121/66917_1 /TAXON_ID=552666 /ORGANISM="Partenskyella glossopodia, Strain RCC365" /LENGTH=178 /DNA_ID=CAMNT_0043100153 /DNA_START=530 /DNA_END=1063 /DNA_ORIENTATION=-
MKWISSWVKLNPTYTYVFWDDTDNDNLISKRFPLFLPAYLGMKPVERADFARIAYLYEFGGIYADMDSECVQNFDSLLNKSGFIGQEPLYHAKLLEHRDNQFASNALMASRRRHPFWLFMMQGIVLGESNGSEDDPVTKTGPRRITKVHESFYHDKNSQKAGLIEIMGEEYFMPEPAW